MSVITTADELMESARTHIQDAYSDILKVLEPETWGQGNYDVPELIDALSQLHKIKEAI